MASRRRAFLSLAVSASLVAVASLHYGARAFAQAHDRGVVDFARGDYARAAPRLLREAEAGDPRAQAYIGKMYSDGLGVPRDYAEAARWLRRAAEQGEPAAQYLLGLAYDAGHGVKQDFVEAEVWLNLAAARADSKRREYFASMRDAVANKLTLDELALSQKRAAEFRPTLDRRP